jgi:adenylate cyclase
MSRATAALWVLMRSGRSKGPTERRAILDKLIADHRGRIANTAGDSVLAEFGSAVDAVQCAVEAQAALA